MIVGHIGGGAVASGGVDTGDIPASLRFRGRSASAYASKTFGTPTSQNSWAFSCFVKFAEMPAGSNYQPILSAGPVATGSWPGETLYIYQDGTIAYFAASSAGTHNVAKRSARVFRDPTGWVHIFVRKTAAANSGLTFVRLWVNNEEVTSWAANTYTGTQASVPDYINVASTSHALGRNFGEYLQGYMSRVCFVDNGGSLLPTDFIQFNTEINELVSKSQSAVKAVVDAGGANSFMLDFDDPNFATYNVGKDYSSKGNHWTPNNFSLTAGTSYDRMLDVPGNSFATFNAIEYAVNTFSDGNLKCVTSAGGSYTSGCSQFFPATGKWYAEVTDTTEANTQIGIAAAGYSGLTQLANQPSGYSYYATSGNKWNNGSSAAYGATYTSGDVIGIIFDADNGKLYFSKNGTIQNSGDPDAGTGYAYNGLTGTYCIAVGDGGTSAATLNLNCGQAPLHASATYHSAAGGYFRYAPPSGYKALCQRNMPDPAILNPEKHFDVLLHSGNTSTQNVTGAQFQPDLAWIKSRNTNYWNFLYDSVRGATKALVSNSTNAEATYAAGLTGFLSNGISLGNQSDVNGSTYTYVDWLWKAGGAAVTNNAGSISSQVSANVNAGFSIATFASPAAGDFSIGHGLSKAPGLVIAKATNGNTFNWAVFHVGVCTNGQFMRLNTTDAKQTPGGNVWGAAIPSATLVNLTATGAVEASKNCVVYSFAEIPGFSKIFTFTGNALADGAIVQCGFKPKFILYKRSDAAANWVIWDAVRSPENVVNDYLLPNSSAAEATLDTLDIVSNGFKLRTTNADNNGGTIVGIAFADVTAKYSLAR